MLFLYNILLFLYFVVTLPFYFYKILTAEKYRIGLWQRMGFLAKLPPRKRILMHTVSVGEFIASIPVINSLKKNFPDHEIIVSTTTLAGNNVAKKRSGEDFRVAYFPLDFSWAVNRFLKSISPSLIVLVETELWPNFLTRAKEKHIPVVVLNGRISGRSFNNYMRVKKMFSCVCADIKCWGVQFERDKERLISLGISEKRIGVTGSVKIDAAVANIPTAERVATIREQYGWEPGLFVLAGGSTHDGEEKILLDIYNEIKDNFKKIVLILAPRHPERAGDIERLIKNYGLKFAKRTDWQKGMKLADYEVILVNTLGELNSIYNLATAVFIGKSLVKGGGQNLLEPAALGKTVVCGPMMGNFVDLTQWLVSNGGAVQVENSDELKKKINELIINSEKCASFGVKARDLLVSATGAVERSIVLVKNIL